MTVIPISSEYVPMIRAGTKVSTVRSGTRHYFLGQAIIRCESIAIPIFITNVVHKRFGQLDETDALRDGFPSLESLRSALHRFYRPIGCHQFVTIVEFRRS